jgi:hypothetical protein
MSSTSFLACHRGASGDTKVKMLVDVESGTQEVGLRGLLQPSTRLLVIPHYQQWPLFTKARQ